MPFRGVPFEKNTIQNRKLIKQVIFEKKNLLITAIKNYILFFFKSFLRNFHPCNQKGIIVPKQ